MPAPVDKSSQPDFSDLAMSLSRARPVRERRLSAMIMALDRRDITPDDTVKLIGEAEKSVLRGELAERDVLVHLVSPAVYQLSKPYHLYAVLLTMQDAVLRLARDGHAFGIRRDDTVIFEALAEGLGAMRTDSHWSRVARDMANDICEELSARRVHAPELTALLRRPQRNRQSHKPQPTAETIRLH